MKTKFLALIILLFSIPVIAQPIDTITGLIAWYTFDNLLRQSEIRSIADSSPLHSNNLTGGIAAGTCFPYVDSIYYPYYFDTTKKVGMKMQKYCRKSGMRSIAGYYKTTPFQGFDTSFSCSFTISFWCFFSPDMDTLIQDFMYLCSSSDPTRGSIEISTHSGAGNPNRIIEVQMRGASVNGIDSIEITSHASSSFLHHIALTWDGALNSGIFYVDNNESPIKVLSSTSKLAVYLASYPMLYLGATYVDVAGYYQEYIADIKIYNRALTRQEVLSYLPKTPVVVGYNRILSYARPVLFQKLGMFNLLGRQQQSEKSANGVYVFPNSSKLILTR